jgi:hypothetical protein
MIFSSLENAFTGRQGDWECASCTSYHSHTPVFLFSRLDSQAKAYPARMHCACYNAANLLLGIVAVGPLCETGGSLFNISKEIFSTWKPSYM